MTIALTVPVPPSYNRAWRIGGRHIYKSKEAREYEEMIRRTVGKLDIKMFDYPDKVGVRVVWHREPKNNRGDLENRTKTLLDSCEELLFRNDGQIRYLESELREVPRGQGRMDIEVWKWPT